MCLWCENPACIGGKKCRHARIRNSLLNSNTFRSAVRRIERTAHRKVTYSRYGELWDGWRPSFFPGVREYHRIDALQRLLLPFFRHGKDLACGPAYCRVCVNANLKL